MRTDEDHRNSINSILDHYDRLVIHHEVGAREFSQLAVRSIVTLNAGVAVAYPTVSEVFQTNLSLLEIVGPSVLSGVGSMLGIFCAYAAYLNFSYAALERACQRDWHVVDADEKFDKVSLYRMGPTRLKHKAHWEEWQTRYDKRHAITFWIASILGIASAFCLLGSITWYAFAVST